MLFFVTEGKLDGQKITEDIIDGYYNMLSARKQYKGEKKIEIVSADSKRIGEPDSEALEKNTRVMKYWLCKS